MPERAGRRIEACREARQGEGLGRVLLFDAFVRSVVAGRQVAARLVGVDPIDERARAFYTAFGLGPIAGGAGGRMYLRLDHAEAALSERPGGAGLPEA